MLMTFICGLTSAQAVLTASGNVRLNSSAGTRLVVQGGVSFTGTANFIDNGRVDLLTNPSGPASNWSDVTAAGAYDATSTGHVFFSATALQTITGPTRFYDLTMNGTTGVSLASDIEVRDNLFLNGGMFTTGANKVYVSNGAANAIQSTNSFASFINGRLERFTNVAGTDYLMPVGKVSGSRVYYAPVRFNKINANTTQYTAEYFRGLPFDHLNRLSPPINRISILEYWELTSNSPGGSVNDDAILSLSWRFTSAISANPADWNDLMIAHYRNNAGFRWEPEFNTLAANIISGTAAFGYVTSNVIVGSFTSMGDHRFTLSSRIPNNVLPLNKIDWQLTAANKTSVIVWDIENDTQVEQYILERSVNGLNFSAIGTIGSKRTNGSASYNFTDGNPNSGWNYYRIRIREANGNSTFTSIKKLQFANNAIVKLSPVPAINQLNIQLGEDPLPGSSLQIITADGKIMYQTNTVKRNMQLNVQSFVSGTYLLRYFNNGTVQTYKFVKLN